MKLALIWRMKMNKEEIAKKLAAITGRPVEEYLGGNNVGSLRHTGSTSKIEDNKSQPIIESNAGKTENKARSVEVIKYQKMFKGSEISKSGKYITRGRQMSRKEYLQFKRNLSYEQLFEHPLMFKMFRAEGQNEVFYPRWVDTFPRSEHDQEQE